MGIKRSRNTAAVTTNDANTSVNLRTTRNTVGGPSAVKSTRGAGPLLQSADANNEISKTTDEATIQGNVTTRNSRNNKNSDPNDNKDIPTISKSASKTKKEIKLIEDKGSNEKKDIGA